MTKSEKIEIPYVVVPRTRFVQPGKIEIDANEGAVIEKCKTAFSFASSSILSLTISRGNTDLTPEDDDELEGYLWPIVREMIKTAIENKQNLIVEGCYTPYDWRRDFADENLSEIKFICLAMTNEYIDAHFSDIKGHGSDIENRLDDSDCTVEWIKEENRRAIDGFRSMGEPITLINDDYVKVISEILSE